MSKDQDSNSNEFNNLKVKINSQAHDTEELDNTQRLHENHSLSPLYADQESYSKSGRFTHYFKKQRKSRAQQYKDDFNQQYSDDVEDQKFFAQFQDKRIRKYFIIKVLGLVLSMLATTIGISVVFLQVQAIKDLFQKYYWIVIIFAVVGFLLAFVLFCFQQAARKYPLNIIILVIFTLIESAMIAAFSAQFDTAILLMGCLITSGVLIGCIVYAAFGGIDFTKRGSIIQMTSVFLAMSALIVTVWLMTGDRNTQLYTDKYRITFGIITIALALMGSIWIVYNLQALMGGHRQQISPDEYIYAALATYLDIITVFMYLSEAIDFITGFGRR